MSITVLYIDDEAPDRKNIRRAVDEANKSAKAELIRCRLVSTLAGLPEALEEDIDLVLADLWYPEDPVRAPEKGFGLPWIIEQVKHASERKGLSRPIPIIAYTSRNLEYCRKHRPNLYDFWDKGSASPEYVAWKFTKIARELSRFRPDAVLQRNLRKLPAGARWHKEVIQMASDYDSGWSEEEQIRAAGTALGDIAYPHLGEQVWTALKPMWSVIQKWEKIDRIRRKPARGHARHVVNVFWLGYYLLNHPHLQEIFAGAWRRRLATHPEGELFDVRESLNDCWFYAALFHDMAQCFEHLGDVRRTLVALFGEIDCHMQLEASPVIWERFNALAEGRKIIGEFSLEPSVEEELQQLWQKSVADGEPDHGILAAIYLRAVITEARQSTIAHEASRAMAMHNLIGKVGEKSALRLSWDDPVTSLLVVCDQVQAWDRGIQPDKRDGENWPDLSELLQLELIAQPAAPILQMGINYISPRHLEHAPLQRRALYEKLTEVLRDKPNRALNRIVGTRPFDLRIDFLLDRKKLPASYPPLSTSLSPIEPKKSDLK